MGRIMQYTKNNLQSGEKSTKKVFSLYSHSCYETFFKSFIRVWKKLMVYVYLFFAN